MTETAAPPLDPDDVLQPSAPHADADFTTGFDDYWGTDETKKVYLGSDNKQYFEIRLMTEGQRARFEKDNNQDLRVDRDQTTTIKIDPGRSRKALIKAATKDWFVVRGGKPVKFNDANLNQFIDGANPRIIDKLEKEIRDYNEWLKNDLTVEEIDKEIEVLQKEREAAVRREAGE